MVEIKLLKQTNKQTNYYEKQNISLIGNYWVGFFSSAVEINENLSINGFIDGSYKMVDSDSGSDSQFLDLDEVELNFLLNVGNVSGTVNIDTDSGANDVDLEQAHFTYSMDNGVSFTFGHYGSALGFEREDPAGLYTFSRAYNDSAFNSGNIDADGNDITGLSVAFAGDSYSLAASLHEARDANLENEDLNLELSFAYTGVENFSIGGGYAWDNQQNSASEVDEMNLHVATNMGKIFLAAEYTQLMNDTADRDAYMLLADYDFNDKWVLHFESVKMSKLVLMVITRK